MAARHGSSTHSLATPEVYCSLEERRGRWWRQREEGGRQGEEAASQCLHTQPSQVGLQLSSTDIFIVINGVKYWRK